MNSAAYPQPYPMNQGQAFNQIVRRPMTDVERQFPIGVYKGVQKAARGFAVVCLVLFMLDTFVLSTIITDPITLDTMSIMMSVFMGVFGLIAIAMAVNTFVVRKKVTDAMTNGSAVEVVGPAYRSSAAGKVQAWTVGPISMMPTREMLGLLQEGMPTRVLCVPSLKAAIAVNNVGLRNGARVMLPPNLEAMAMPMGMVGYPTAGQAPSAPFAAYGPPATQAQSFQAEGTEEIPPPPTD